MGEPSWLRSPMRRNGWKSWLRVSDERSLERSEHPHAAVRYPLATDLRWCRRQLRRSLGQAFKVRLDPFLMLDEFSSDNADDYIAGFPPTRTAASRPVTYMLDGHACCTRTISATATCSPAAAQWMTAGRGIIHSRCRSSRKVAYAASSSGSTCRPRSDDRRTTATSGRTKFRPPRSPTASLPRDRR